jgi:hypothetical protein
MTARDRFSPLLIASAGTAGFVVLSFLASAYLLHLFAWPREEFGQVLIRVYDGTILSLLLALWWSDRKSPAGDRQDPLLYLACLAFLITLWHYPPSLDPIPRNPVQLILLFALIHRVTALSQRPEPDR